MLPTSPPPICLRLTASELVDRKTLDAAVAAVSVSTPFDDPAFEERLLAKLVASEAINGWQSAQLRAGASNFRFGEYRAVDLLGRGGYATVFLGRPFSFKSNRDRTRSKTFEDVAIKATTLDRKNGAAAIGVVREIEIAKLLDCPQIVRGFGWGTAGSTFYGVYEYVDGGSVVGLRKRLGGRLPYRVAAYVVSETARALDYLRRVGLVHRDVKPANVLLTRDGKVKLADFGFVSPIEPFSAESRLSPLGEKLERLDADLAESRLEGAPNDDDSAVRSGLTSNDGREGRRRVRVKGTPDYLAPDQTLYPDSPSHLWDVYSLGCALYWALTGYVPFQTREVAARDAVRAHLSESDPPPEPSEFDPLIPEPLSALTMRMMAQKPENRIESAAKIVEELARWTPKSEEIARKRAVFNASGGDDSDFWSPECLDACLISPSVRTSVGGVSSGFAASTSFAKANKLGDKRSTSTRRNVRPPERVPRGRPTSIDAEAEKLERLNAALVRRVVYPLLAALVAVALAVVASLF